MAEIDQFDMFLPIPDEMDFLRADFKAVKESCDKVRKGQYAKIGEMMKMFLDIQARLEILERNICRGKNA